MSPWKKTSHGQSFFLKPIPTQTSKRFCGGWCSKFASGEAPMAEALRVCPITVKAAIPFVRQVHRRLPKIQGAMWAVGAIRVGELIGVALVGAPARMLMADTLAVLRVAVIEGVPNACSMLYGACSRAGKAMCAENMVTYTHADESGTSLKAAGWIDGGLTDGGEWDRPD